MTLQALKNEITNDPQTYGYAGWVAASEPENIAAALNKVRTGNDGEAAITVRRSDIGPDEVLEVIDNRDFIASASLNPAHVSWFESVTQLPRIRLVKDDGSDTRVLGNLRRLLENPGAQGSRARLALVADRNGSRAEQLWGAGTVVSTQDVAMALQLP
jgi:hypothetical protein